MEESKNIYSGYHGFQQWHQPIGERKEPLPLPVEIHLLILDYLTNMQQLELRLVSKDWAVISASKLTGLLSDKPDSVPLPFVKEFLHNIKEKFFFVHPTKKLVEAVDLLGDATVNTPADLFIAIANSIRKLGDSIKYGNAYILNQAQEKEVFPKGWQASLHGLAEEQQFLATVIEKSFEISFLSQGFFDNSKGFRLNYAKRAGSSIFSNEDFSCPLLCLQFSQFGHNLRRIELTNYDKSQELSSKALISLFLILAELKNLEVLDLQGLRISEESMKILIVLLTENTSIKSVHLTKECITDSIDLLNAQKPKRKTLKITVHRNFPQETSNVSPSKDWDQDSTPLW